VTPAEEARRLQRLIADQLAAARWSEHATPAGLYLRVSTRGQTAENQVVPLVTMAAARGYRVEQRHVFIEKESGGDIDRAEVVRATEASARGQIRALLVWAIDRLSRDDTFAGGVREIGTFDHHGCAVLSHEETYIDSSGPFRPVLLQFALRIASDERKKKARRTQDAVHERIRQIREGRGFWRKEKDGRPSVFIERWGRPPKHDPAVRARALEINAETPGLTVGQIARTLCAESGGQKAVNKETVRSWLDKEGRTYGKATLSGGAA
jgi:DNA invertase Pin-like site-specific DNA recombinase